MKILSINDIQQEIIDNGGVSYNPKKGIVNPTTGFMVSLPDSEKVVNVSELTSADIRAQLTKMLARDSENLFFGAWVDDNKVYLDFSLNLEDKNEALLFGELWAQLAIWDCANSETIYLENSQEVETA